MRAGPTERRRFLDQTLAVIDPKAGRAAEEVDKILRQRGALLRNNGRNLSPEVATTLDVWDARLDESGTALVEAREPLVDHLAPLADCPLLAAGRSGLRRGAGLPAVVGGRAGGSTGRSRGARTSSEACRWWVPTATSWSCRWTASRAEPTRHRGSSGPWPSPCSWPPTSWPRERLGSAPLLLLDDVFSELDPFRSQGAAGRTPSGPDAVDHRPAGTARGGGGQGLRDGPGGVRGVRRSAARHPIGATSDDDHAPRRGGTRPDVRSTPRSTRSPGGSGCRTPGASAAVRPLGGAGGTGDRGPREAGPARRGIPGGERWIIRPGPPRSGNWGTTSSTGWRRRSAWSGRPGVEIRVRR